MRIGNSCKRLVCSVVGAALAVAVVALSATTAGATTVTMRADAWSSTGFDNSTLLLPSAHSIGASDWLSGGTGALNGIAVTENQCLRLQSESVGVCNSSLALGAGPFASDVTWNVTNTSGLSGPALLFFSGVANFATGTSYDPSNIRIIMADGDAEVVQYTSGPTDYYYLGFLINDFSQPVTFTYEVDAAQLAGGTPQLLVNSAFSFVPEPSTGLLVCSGLIGLGVMGRRRSS